MRMRIRSIDVERLIALVEQNRILYDRKHPFFRSIVRREMVWKEISQLLNAEIYLVKNKWMTLRNTYKKYGSQRTTWKWGPYFRFMEEHLNLKRIPNIKDLKETIEKEKESIEKEKESIEDKEEPIKDEEEIVINQIRTEELLQDPLAFPHVETENKDDVLASNDSSQTSECSTESFKVEISDNDNKDFSSSDTSTSILVNNGSSQTSESLIESFKVDISNNDNKDFSSGDTSTSMVDLPKLETTLDYNKDLIFPVTSASTIIDSFKEEGK